MILSLGLNQDLLLDDGFDENNYVWISLGFSSIGVKNDEGYSREYLDIGLEKNKVEVVRLTERFFYDLSQEYHHEDIRYFKWNGSIRDYIDKRTRKTYV